LKEHFDDAYVKKSRQQGYRSRASFKLLEIQKRDRLIRPGMTIIDLGAAPGGWSQVAAQLTGSRGQVIASDLLPMEPLEQVEFIQGDFSDVAVLERILAAAGEDGVDLVISDMAPNLSGMKDIDQPRMLELAELALELAGSVLKPGGGLLVKAFQGAGLENFQRELRNRFLTVKVRKPQASRARSAELYLLAEGLIATD